MNVNQYQSIVTDRYFELYLLKGWLGSDTENETDMAAGRLYEP